MCNVASIWPYIYMAAVLAVEVCIDLILRQA